MNNTEHATLRSPVRCLPGIGERRAALFSKLGINTLGDLLYHLPRSYQNRGYIRTVADAAGELRRGYGELFRTDDRDAEASISESSRRMTAPAAYMLTVGSLPRTSRLRGRMTVTKFDAFDDSGKCKVYFFNQPYAADNYKIGDRWRFWGRMSINAGYCSLTAPQAERAGDGKTLPPFVAVYPLTGGLTTWQVAAAVASAFKILGESSIPDIVPAALREKYGLLTRREALLGVHSPHSADELCHAQNTLFFEEIFLFSLGLGRADATGSSLLSPAMSRYPLEPLLEYLPFNLTEAQKRSIDEISADMCSANGRAPEYVQKSPMRRLLSGDVGSGKTVCAAAAVYEAAANGWQCAFMAPTEILAAQHYSTLAPLFERCGIRTALLTGSTKLYERREILTSLEDGSTACIIGTHALFSDGVTFARLGLVVTDEQHRFGVMQRAALNEKAARDGGEGCHMLVMSATPIPRTLALILYRDLSLSTLDGMPPGRQRVDTFVVGESYRERLNAFIAKQVSEGHQVYIVCPSIESSDEDEENGLTVLSPYDAVCPIPAQNEAPVRNVTDQTAALREALPDISIACVHGRMKGADKESVMTAFARGEYSVLVSTTVIEVGVDVPNATLMIIENAERFGLAQLHQLRGRVGRGSAKSYCVLVSDCRGGNAGERLEVMRKMSDGYAIAERDLALRGPGDFFAMRAGEEKQGETGGIRQHGGFAFRVASRCSDTSLMKAAAEEAAAILATDPALIAPENRAAAEASEISFGKVGNTLS